MKGLLRNYLINIGALWLTSQMVPSLAIVGGLRGLLLGSLAFMIANILLVPFLKIILLPLNLLTLGIFAWLANVLALYFLVGTVAYFQLLPYHFPGIYYEGFMIPAVDLSTFQVAIVVSFIISFVIHFIQWLVK